MPLSYFLLDTYPGFFVLALPFGAAAWVICWLLSARQSPSAPLGQRLCRGFFAAYLTGLVCLTLLLDPLRMLWHCVLFGRGSAGVIPFFTGSFDFVPHPWKWLLDPESSRISWHFSPSGRSIRPRRAAVPWGKRCWRVSFAP